jgi:hypothetical protein
VQLLLLFVVSVLLCIPAWYIARRSHVWFPWDYVGIFGPYLVWLVLAISRVGSNSLANLVEIVILAALVPGVISIRVFLLDRIWSQPTKTSLAACVFCCLVLPLGLRLGMPGLSE